MAPVLIKDHVIKDKPFQNDYIKKIRNKYLYELK